MYFSFWFSRSDINLNPNNYCDIKKTPDFLNFLKPYINICNKTDQNRW